MTFGALPRAAASAAATVLLAAAAFAQDTTRAPTGRPPALIAIGSNAEDDVRMQQLDGTDAAGSAGWLLRSTSMLAQPLQRSNLPPRRVGGCDARWRAIAPSTDVLWSSTLPFARNDGPLWAGRGYSARITAGARAACGRVRVNVAPTFWYAENTNFLFAPSATPGLSTFISPLHAGGLASVDLPQRFGVQSIVALDPGETSVEVDAGPVTAAVSTESQWWGPAIRNALVMSNHAAGVPRIEARTRHPLATRAGRIEMRWMVGALTESPYFDDDTRNDLRSLSGVVATLRTAFDTNLTVGAARVVYAPIPGLGALLARALDAVGRWGEGSNVRTARQGRAAEQLTELFARWLVPASRAEVYAEWARMILPASLRSLLIAPQVTEGYTLGMQWANAPTGSERRWRAQLEFTQLEQDVETTPASFYTSPVVPQGYTQRGQTIGAAIGPGSNSQWIALDHLARLWRLGAFAGRVRWDNDAYYRQPTSVNGFAHDVSVYAGLRGSHQLPLVDFGAEIVSERRMNYLYQSACAGFCANGAYDVRNVSLRLTASPRF